MLAGVMETKTYTLYEPVITYRARQGVRRKLDSADKLAARFRELFTELNPDPTKEAVIIVTLSTRFMEVGYRLMSLGSSRNALIAPADTMRAALLLGGVGFAIAHNHPSGDPSPSAADVRITATIREAAKAVGVDFIDHLVIGDVGGDPLGVGHYSFRSAGQV
jgi:DNA repair protein RadC